MQLNKAYVYILSNKNRTVLYIGVTNNLESRVSEHRNGMGSVFTAKYNVHDLLYYEILSSFPQAIKREKQLKEWKRAWKLDLIKTMNAEMIDLASDWEQKFRICFRSPINIGKVIPCLTQDLYIGSRNI